MSKIVKKRMTWTEMQASKYVSDSDALQDLSICDVVSAFELVDEYCNANSVSIEIDRGVISITIELA